MRRHDAGDGFSSGLVACPRGKGRAGSRDAVPIRAICLRHGPPSVSGRCSSTPSAGAGFTLLELLVSMVILTLIVLMMSTVFHQSVRAWESGMRRTEMSMEGRSALSFVAHELGQATADKLLCGPGGIPCKIEPGTPGNATAFRFFTVDEASADHRALQVVSYWKSGDKLKRRRQLLQVGDSYPQGGATDDHELINGVQEFQIVTPDGASFTTNLPPWVGIKLKLAKTAHVSGIKAWSVGLDMEDDAGGDDDVPSWGFE